ncbi:unnamed protein product [Rhizophagus irregularis]|nr:unnamed protein product [Rhizophagus irregularis]
MFFSTFPLHRQEVSKSYYVDHELRDDCRPSVHKSQMAICFKSEDWPDFEVIEEWTLRTDQIYLNELDFENRLTDLNEPNFQSLRRQNWILKARSIFEVPALDKLDFEIMILECFFLLIDFSFFIFQASSSAFYTYIQSKNK